jgi:hypothetical protein
MRQGACDADPSAASQATASANIAAMALMLGAGKEAKKLLAQASLTPPRL